jgi:hypothetical protein
MKRIATLLFLTAAGCEPDGREWTSADSGTVIGLGRFGVKTDGAPSETGHLKRSGDPLPEAHLPRCTDVLRGVELLAGLEDYVDVSNDSVVTGPCFIGRVLVDRHPEDCDPGTEPSFAFLNTTIVNSEGFSPVGELFIEGCGAGVTQDNPASPLFVFYKTGPAPAGLSLEVTVSFTGGYEVTWRKTYDVE